MIIITHGLHCFRDYQRSSLPLHCMEWWGGHFRRTWQQDRSLGRICKRCSCRRFRRILYSQHRIPALLPTSTWLSTRHFHRFIFNRPTVWKVIAIIKRKKHCKIYFCVKWTVKKIKQIKFILSTIQLFRVLSILSIWL